MTPVTNLAPLERLKGMGKVEFIAMMAALMAINALAIDIMLPALQQIGAALNVEDENERQFIVSSYLFGLGFAQLIYGPISDRFGRRNPMIFGLVLYIICSLAIVVVPSFAGLLILRFIQGAGAAATRVISVSIVRDVFGGRAMAEVMSLIMMVFMIVPIIAPGTGQLIMLGGNWHLIFLFIGIMAALIMAWIIIRLPETLTQEDIRPLTVTSIVAGFRIVLTNRIALCYTIAATSIFGSLFGFINSAQQVYVGIYDLGPWFPVAFAAVAAFMSLASFLNSKFVGQFGMRRLSHASLLGFIVVTFLWLMVQLVSDGPMPFWMFLSFFAVAMFQFGWIGANFNSLAMEPLGHVAGTASAVLGFMSTVGGAAIGAVIGQAFDGTALPMVAGFFVVSVIGLVFVLLGEGGKLFQQHNPKV